MLLETKNRGAEIQRGRKQGLRKRLPGEIESYKRGLSISKLRAWLVVFVQVIQFSPAVMAIYSAEKGPSLRQAEH